MVITIREKIKCEDLKKKLNCRGRQYDCLPKKAKESVKVKT